MTTRNGFSRTTIEFPEGEYMRRWIFQCRLFTLRLHKIQMEDEYSPHNHPWSFVSVQLSKAGYLEALYDESSTGSNAAYPRPSRWIRSKRFIPRYRNKDTIHRVCPWYDIDTDSRVPVWTFVVTGPKRSVKFETEQREDASWGFLNEDGTVTHWRFHKDNRPTVDTEGQDLNG